MILQKIHFPILLILLTVTSLTSVFGQNEIIWSDAWQYGPADAVFVDVSSDIAYLGSGGAVFTIDVNDPENPILINDDIRTAGFVRDIWYNQNDGNLYLACGRGGLEVWDVSDNNDPALLSRTEILYFDTETPVEEIEIYNDIAVLMCDWGYVHTVDISDPMNPVQLHFNGVMGNPAHHIFVDESGTIHATGAQYYTRLTLGSGGTINNAGQKEFLYGAGNLSGRDNEAFVQYGGNMYILDLNAPGFLAWSITEVSFSDIVVRHDTAFLVNEDGFEIWDVTNLQSPAFIASVPFDYGNEIFMDDNRVYVSADHEGLKVLDISHPLDPQIISQLPAYGFTSNLDLLGDMACVANAIGLLTVDISNLANQHPEALGILPTEGQTTDISVSGNMAFLADWTGGLRIIDLTDPENPEEVSSVPINAWKVTSNNNIVYVSDVLVNENDTLKIYDVSNPQFPVFTGSVTLAPLLQDMEYKDMFVYASNHDAGLRIIDVSDPYAPFEASSINLPWVQDAAIDSNFLFIASADWDGGLVSVDISDPVNPIILQIYNPDGWFHPFHLDVAWPYAYASDIYGEIYVFDVTNPSNIQLIETMNLPGDIFNIMGRDGFIYVSNAQAGMQILENTLITDVPTNNEISDKEPAINIYPNPSEGPVIIEVVMTEERLVEAVVYDTQGRIVNVTGNHLKKGINRLYWDGTDALGASVANGMYFYTVTSPYGVKAGKIILQ